MQRYAQQEVTSEQPCAIGAAFICVFSVSLSLSFFLRVTPCLALSLCVSLSLCLSLSLSLSLPLSSGRQTDRHTEADRQTDTQTHTDTQTQTHTDTHRPTQRQTDRQTDIDTDTQPHRHTQTQTTHTHTTDRQTAKETQTHTQRYGMFCTEQAMPVQVIETNTFSANKFSLERYNLGTQLSRAWYKALVRCGTKADLGTQVTEINAAGVRIAKEAVAESGCVSPYAYHPIRIMILAYVYQPVRIILCMSP
eukprot:1068765-Rhodomonas_salina.2